MTFVDTHCHLQFEAFSGDTADVIARARKALCKAFIVVGAKMDSSLAAGKLAERHDDIFAAVGIHPHHADKLEDGWIDELRRLTSPEPRQRRVVALGEIGLDYHYYASNGIIDPNVQKRVLCAQFTLAHELKLPVILHCRDAWQDFLPLVAQYMKGETRSKGVFHCWSGSLGDAEKAIDMGFFISFAGNLTFPPRGSPSDERSGATHQLSTIQQVAKHIPLDRILLETDAPYLAPQPVRGKRNEPAYITHTAAFLAKLRNEPLEKIAQVTTENAKRLFNLPRKKV